MNVCVFVRAFVRVLFQSLQTEIQSLKDQVQELHRDLTKHHSIINTEKMGEILDRSLHVDSQIGVQYSTVETMRVIFEEVSLVTIRTLSLLPLLVRTAGLWGGGKPLGLNQPSEPFPHRSGMRLFRGSATSRRSTKVGPHQSQHFCCTFFLKLKFCVVPESSAAARPDAAEAGELLPDHHHQTDQPIHPVYS